MIEFQIRKPNGHTTYWGSLHPTCINCNKTEHCQQPKGNIQCNSNPGSPWCKNRAMQQGFFTQNGLTNYQLHIFPRANPITPNNHNDTIQTLSQLNQHSTLETEFFLRTKTNPQ